MQPPTTIKAGPYDYRVLYSQKRLDRYALISGDHGLGGYVSHDQCEIVVEPGLPATLQREILWHEVLHLVHQVAGLTDRETVGAEEAVTLMGVHSLAILRDNPQLVAYLTEE